MISEFLFKKCMNHIEKMCRYENKLNSLAYQYECEPIPLPDRENCMDMAIEVIEAWCNELCDGEIGDIVSYFCWELEFGKRWEPGFITEADGTDIDISTVDKLYDYIKETIGE